MHPAPSVIVFTSLSGLGFGLFMWLGLGMPDVFGWEAFAWFFVAYALSVGGLMSSVFHLANVKNARFALSQWRTSWLSREGVLAIVTLLVFAVFAVGRIFFGLALPVFGIVGAAGALATVYSTSMIYTQLKTIPRWNLAMNPVLYLLYAIAGGALLSGQAMVAAVLIVLLTALQVAAWISGDARAARPASDKGTATGLGHLGDVRLLESAHTARNYVLDEMAFKIGRKHAQKLRLIVGISLGAVPVVLLVALPGSLAAMAVAFASHLVGVFASRWLFFAEAEHVVSIYYARG
jgi:DMSO reductase anchor subunit